MEDEMRDLRMCLEWVLTCMQPARARRYHVIVRRKKAAEQMQRSCKQRGEIYRYWGKGGPWEK